MLRIGGTIKVGSLGKDSLSAEAEETFVYAELRAVACRSDYFASSLPDFCRQEKISLEDFSELFQLHWYTSPTYKKAKKMLGQVSTVQAAEWHLSGSALLIRISASLRCLPVYMFLNQHLTF